MTFPYRADTPRLLATTLGQRVRVTAVRSGSPDLPLDVESLALSWDEATAPRVQATCTARVPVNQADLDYLDPRTPVRLVIRAGYVRPDGIEDMHTIANLGVSARTVGRPANQVQLEATSDERLVLEAAPSGTINPAQATIAGAVRELLAYTYGGEPPAFSATGRATTQAPLGFITVPPDGELWPVIDNAVDQANADVFDDGLRRWRVIDRPILTAPSLTVQHGVKGTLTNSASALTRESWHNAAQIVYRWMDEQSDGAGGTFTVERSVIGYASVKTGPLAAVPGNRRVYRETRDIEVTQAAANAAAASVLARRLADGRSVGVSAITAWWVRPGMTVQIVLPTGSPILALIVRVAFDHPAGRMTLTVRQPDDANPITSGE